MLVCFILFFPEAMADMPRLHGYSQSGPHYQYVTFGTYPSGKNAEVQPVIWRVLGQGMPGKEDVINASNVPEKHAPKVPRQDSISEENADVYCLMTEYIIDFLLYNAVRDDQEGLALDYVDSLLYDTLNGEVLSTLFTQKEQDVLLFMPERGLIAPPSRFGELFREDYGFPSEDFCKSENRHTVGTSYAYRKGLKHVKGYSWYWTSDWRAPGRRWIVADDGHISVSGVNREGGVRLICYVHTNRLDCEGGRGTLEDPYRLVVAD